MFNPSSLGTIKRKTGRDVHGMAIYGAAESVRFAPINMTTSIQRTPLRGSSTGSQGRADLETTPSGVILLPADSNPQFDDLFSFRGLDYLIRGIDPMFTVSGDLDHYHVKIELTPV